MAPKPLEAPVMMMVLDIDVSSRSSGSGAAVASLCIVVPGTRRSPLPLGRGSGQDRPAEAGADQTREPPARPGGISVVRQDAVELTAGADPELGEHVAEVVLGGARAD